jgi:hypothetical protein
MPSNGQIPDILDLGDLSVATKTVSVTRNGEKVFLEGYVNGDNCIASVVVRVRASSDRYKLVALDEESSQEERVIALTKHYREVIQAIIPGIDIFEAEVFANDPDRVHKLMVYLEWETDDNDDEVADPEVVGEAESPSTGVESSPSSVRRTTGRRGKRS